MSKIIRLFNWYKYYLNSISLTWGIMAMIIGILFILILRWMYYKEKIERKSIIPLWLSAEYYFLTLASTVFSRVKADIYRYNLNPFDMFDKLFNGNIDNRYEVYLNILLLLPIGFLLSTVCEKLKIVLIGFTMSSTIEVLQLISLKGTFEIGDILMNTLGIFLGIEIYKLAIRIINSPSWAKVKKTVFKVFKK